MKVLCPLNDLREAFNVVIQAVPSKTTVDALNYVLARAEKNVLKLYSYNMETGIIYSLPCDVVEDGLFTLNAKLFQDILRKLPNDVVNLYTEGNLIRIESGTSKFNIHYIDPNIFPEISVIEDSEKKGSFRIRESLLASMINKTLFSAAKDSMRRLFNSLFFNIYDKTLDVVGLDGYRLALARNHFTEEDEFYCDYTEDKNLIIPSKALHELKFSLDENKKDEEDSIFTISYSSNKVLIENERIKLISSIFEGEYCDYKQMLPKSHLSEIIIDKDYFYAAIDRSTLITSGNIEKRKQVTIFTDDGEYLKIKSESGIGDMAEQIPIEFSGENVDLDFNSLFIIEALKVVSDEKIKFSSNGSMGACTITPIEGDSYLLLLLPVRK